MSNDNNNNYHWEEVKLITDGLKHLTTLAAGVIVLLATFLKDIFPNKNGALAVSGELKLLIAMSFVFLGISLVTSILYIVLVAPPGAIPIPAEASETEKSELLNAVRRRRFKRTALSRLLSASAFVLGILCFGAAVLINLEVF